MSQYKFTFSELEEMYNYIDRYESDLESAMGSFRYGKASSILEYDYRRDCQTDHVYDYSQQTGITSDCIRELIDIIQNCLALDKMQPKPIEIKKISYVVQYHYFSDHLADHSKHDNVEDAIKSCEEAKQKILPHDKGGWYCIEVEYSLK